VVVCSLRVLVGVLGCCMHADSGDFLGTFARVWLVRLANPLEEDRDKVYALKVLRKVEGECSMSSRQFGGFADLNCLQLSSSSRSTMLTTNVKFFQMLLDTLLLLH
jgi:hypothetical protein